MLCFLSFWILDDIRCYSHTQRTTWLEIQLLSHPFLPPSFLSTTPWSLVKIMSSAYCSNIWATLDTGELWPHTAPWFLLSEAPFPEVTLWPALISWRPLLPFRRWRWPTRFGTRLSPLCELLSHLFFSQYDSRKRSSFLFHCPSYLSRELWWLLSLLLTLFALDLENTESPPPPLSLNKLPFLFSSVLSA